MVIFIINVKEAGLPEREADGPQPQRSSSLSRHGWGTPFLFPALSVISVQTKDCLFINSVDPALDAHRGSPSEPGPQPCG